MKHRTLPAKHNSMRWIKPISFAFIVSCANAQAENIDVMMVFDTTAKSWVDNNGGMELFGLDIANRMNQVASNSGLDLEFTIVHSMGLDYTTTATTSSSSFVTDLVALSQGQDEFAKVATARETYGADLVTMMVDHGSAYGNVGLGYSLIYWQGDSNAAFSVAAIRSVDISNTLVHELGHNMGAAHPKAISSSAGPNSYLDNQYSAGWFFSGTNGTNYATAMGYNYNNGIYYAGAPLFSTPYVNYQGTPAGDQADADNTRLLSETMSVIANYRASMCIAGNVSAWNTVTGELADFDSSCDVGDEWEVGTPPDTDGDGLDDADELRQGLDPNDPSDAAVESDVEVAEDSDGDGTPDLIDSNPDDPAYRGSDLISVKVTNDWSHISLPSAYIAPVIIAGPPSYNSGSPGVVRIKNVTSDGYEGSFQINFSEWDYLDGAHVGETIPHVALESGRYTMPDGSIWEAGTFTLDKTRSFAGQVFSQSFPKAPQLFLTIQTANEDQAVTVRAKSVTANGFSAALYEQESLNNGHTAETIGYLALYSPTGSGLAVIGGQEVSYLTQNAAVTHQWLPIINSSIFVEEEQSRDIELGHTTEYIDAVSIAGELFAQDVSARGGDTSSLRQKPQANNTPVEWGYINDVADKWITVPLGKTYNNPVVAASVGDLSSELGAIQIRNVTKDSFQIHFTGWDYQNSVHVNAEKVFYLVAESGEYQLGDLVIKAGHTNVAVTASQSVSVDFGSAFDLPPVIFTSINNVNDAEVAVVRVLSSSITGMQIALQEQESLSNGHNQEAVGWIAIEPGTTTLGGRSVEVVSVYGASKTVAFADVSSNKHPVVVTSLNSYRGTDTAYAAHRHLSATQVTVYVQEEQSRDTEVGHTNEHIGVFIAD